MSQRSEGGSDPSQRSESKVSNPCPASHLQRTKSATVTRVSNSEPSPSQRSDSAAVIRVSDQSQRSESLTVIQVSDPPPGSERSESTIRVNDPSQRSESAIMTRIRARDPSQRSESRVSLSDPSQRSEPAIRAHRRDPSQRSESAIRVSDPSHWQRPESAALRSRSPLRRGRTRSAGTERAGLGLSESPACPAFIRVGPGLRLRHCHHSWFRVIRWSDRRWASQDTGSHL